MLSTTPSVPDVFTPREIAKAAGVSARAVAALVASGAVPAIDGRFVAAADAVRAVRRLRRDTSSVAPIPSRAPELFHPHEGAERSPGRALLASGALHALTLAALVVVTGFGVAAAKEPKAEPSRTRMVFLVTPGPGGGGGGGGLRQPAPARRAELKGASALRSPVPPPRRVVTRPEPEVRRTPPPVRPRPVERPVEPPPVATTTQPQPQVVAPVASVAADASDQAGVPVESAPATTSQGPGIGGGAGTGQGTGLGEGDGAGIGPGSGGGTGGGPYRAGSGISAPSIVREVKPDYTEDARRRGIEGDVVLEIVVRRDGSVGTVTLLEGLGAGLDQRAIDAVRQWRFAPAMRLGTAVDVVVEVAVEFSLR